MPLDMALIVIPQLRHGLFQPGVTDGTPGAGNVGDDVNLQFVHEMAFCRTDLWPL
jgi:hypothetical protein